MERNPVGDGDAMARAVAIFPKRVAADVVSGQAAMPRLRTTPVATAGGIVPAVS